MFCGHPVKTVYYKYWKGNWTVSQYTEEHDACGSMISVYSSPLSLGGSESVGGVWVGSGRFEPKERRRRKDLAAFMVGVWGGGIPFLS